MGTRSLTHIKDGGKDDATICTIYRQFDGYPEGHGVELAKILASRILVNGISGDGKTVFNGMNCLAAQVVRQLKDDEAGGIYLCPPDSDGEEFNYTVYMVPIPGAGFTGAVGTLHIKCDEVKFDGPVSDFLAKYAPKEETATA